MVEFRIALLPGDGNSLLVAGCLSRRLRVPA